MQSVPNRIGKYELISRLGRGGMGEVYKAFHPQLQRYVAIKILLTSTETDPEFILRFQQEAMAVARLRHPHIVQVFDFDIVDDKPYMVMEFIEGETLGQRLSRYHRSGQFMPLDEVARLFQHLCQAVDYAHRQGMLHRDLKPANVIINHQNDAILTDFGLAKIAGVSGLTASGTVMGTPHYMSPEQAQGQVMDERSDVYSLSVMLYEALEGKVPFEADTPVAVIMQQITKPPPALTANPAVPAELGQIALTGMAKQPNERFQRAGAMGVAIAAALHMQPIRLSGYPEGQGTKTAEMPPAMSNTLETVAAPAAKNDGLATRAAPEAGNIQLPPLGRQDGPPQFGASPAAPPGQQSARRKPSKALTRVIIVAALLLLIAINAGILTFILSNNGSNQPVTTNGPTTVGSIAFTDNDPNDFSHPANVLTGAFTGLQQPAGGFNYFAWLCDSAASKCTLLGAVTRQSDGKATLTKSATTNLLGGPDLKQLQSTLTFEITQEQTEATSPPDGPSKQVVYSGHIPANVLLHIRHQLTAFPKQGIFANNSTALDTGLGEDAALLQQLSQQLQRQQSANNLAGMKVTAEMIFNLIAGKEGAQDLNGDNTINTVQGDDGFGMGTDASISATDCSGGPNSTYLPLTLQHACLAAKASGSATFSQVLTQMLQAGKDISSLLTSIQSTAQKIAAAQTTSDAFADVNQLLQQADSVLNGSTSDTGNQAGAKQVLALSEQMATITVSQA